MSSCLIITQGNKMYIGADTACSVKTKDGYKRISNDMPKLFTLGNSVFFCSGKKADAERCVNWIFDNFERSIDFDKLGIYLRENFNIINEDNVFNIEFLLCDYDNHSVIQLSQYNNFEPVIYDYAEQVRIICGGYKTNDSFTMAKKNIALNESVFNIYKNVFEAISDECVGGNMIIYNSPTNYETYRLEEKNISYCNINENNLFLLTSDFVTSGVINGSQIIGGDIYSTNYSSTEGSHMNLLDGSLNFGHKIIYDAPTRKMTIKGVDIEWSSSTTPEISDINGLNDTLTTQSASITANANAIATEVTRAKGAEELLSSSITQTADNIILAVEKNLTDNYSTTTQMEAAINLKADSITSTVSETYETKENANSQYNTLSSSITQTANSITSEVSRATAAEASLSSSITQTATAIESKVSKTDYNGKQLVSLINQTAEAVSINANKINLNGAVTANNYFKINTDGSMESKSGKIGGWTIASTYIGNSKTGGSIYITSVDDNSDYWIRTHNAANGGGTRTFSVSKAGVLYATGAEISGTLTAGSGSIIGSSGSGWKITGDQIHTIKTNGSQPLLTLSAGANASSTFLHAPDCFQIGGVDPNGNPVGANFTAKVTIGQGGCNITGNCTITGTATASNLTLTGGKVGNWSISSDGTLKGIGTNSNTIELYPAGKNVTIGSRNYKCYIIIWDSGGSNAVGGLAEDGWKSL